MQSPIMTADLNDNQAKPPQAPTASPLTPSEPPRRGPHELAIFLDLDGTLAPIQPTPGQAGIPPSTINILQRLYAACARSVAIVSGRDAADIDRMLAPLRVPYAALHGARLKGPDGRIVSISVRQEVLAEIIGHIEIGAASLPGTLIERKTLSVALHYRNAPQFEDAAQRLAAGALNGHGADFEVQQGKMVVEIKPRAASKGTAIEHFMNIAPFRGRIPLFAGDDLTDESAFRAVNAMNGISIKIGTGPTQARWRLDDPAALSAWLGSLLPIRNPTTALDTIKDKT